MLKRIIPVITVLLAIPMLLMAQVTTSSLTGTVKNAQDEVLAGASITAVHVPSGTKYSTTSGSKGQFTINNMRPGGPYTVEITYVGYQKETQSEVYLRLAESFLLNTNLKSTTEELQTVVVASAGRRNPILNANRTGASTNVSSREIQRLPTISRSLNDFTKLTPQANPTSNGPAIGGGNYRQNYITVDGSDFNNSFGIGGNLPAGGSPISLDAVEEISVNITPFDIRQSGFIGSSINTVTRSGTNNFSGSAYTYFRNQNQQGNEVKGGTFPRQPLDYKQYGVRVGGPIIKNKLFFFFNYETEEQTSPGQLKTAATAALPFGSNSLIARPTATELDNIRQYLMDNYEYDPGGYQGYDFVSDKTKIVGRIDWNINSKHRLNIRYSQVESKDPSFVSTSTSSSGVPSYPFGAGRNDINALHFENSNYFQDRNFYSLAAELNSTFGRRVSNQLRFSFNKQDEPRSTNSTLFPFVDIMKDGQPFTAFGYEPFSYGNFREVEIYSFFDNVNIQAGKHNLTLGVQVDLTKTLNGFQPLGASYYRFNSWDDFVNGVKPNDFAMTHSLSPGFAQAFSAFKFNQYSAYFQDEISVNSKFKLTIGLRGDLSTYPDVEQIQTNPLVAGLTFADGKKMNTGELPASKVMLSPRLGFNYDIYGDRSLQVRGGTGIFTGRVPFVWIVGQSANSGMVQVTRSFNNTTANPNVTDPYLFNPNIGAHWPSTVPVAGTVVPSTVTAFSPDFKLPQTWKTSLAVDMRLGGGVVATLEGIYNRDLRTAYSKHINLAAPSPLNVSGYPDNRMIYPNSNQQKFINTLNGAGVPTVGGTSPLTAILTENGNKGHYMSFTAKLDKQFSKGLFASIAYVKSFANNLYDGDGDQPINTWNLIPHVDGPNFPTLGMANFVTPDRIIATLSLRKEYLKHLGTTVSLVYDGGIQGRFSYIYSADFNRDGSNGDLIYIPRNPSEITFVDRPASSATNGVAYTAAQQSELFFKYIEQDKYLRKHKGQYAERNGAKGPWRNQVDFKLIQDLFTQIGGKRNTLQFTVDIFNFGNLLNSHWGVIKTVNAASILVPQNISALTPGGSVKPTFWLQVDRNNPATTTFRDNFSLTSTYYMQFGFRYIFNN
jgi:hypothetical protein